MMKNDSDHHDADEKETVFSRHGVAKKPCAELQKPCVTDQAYCNETEQRDDHKRSGSSETQTLEKQQ